MIYIRKDDFSIWDEGEVDESAFFEVDECIAPAIQVLNRKGYRTTYCCCGHPFPSHGEADVPMSVPDPFHIIVGTYEAVPQPDNKDHFDEGQYHIRFINDPALVSYISFENNVVLPYLPEGWSYDDDSPNVLIQYRFDDSREWKPLEFMKERLRVMEELYDWAAFLPEQKEEGRDK